MKNVDHTRILVIAIVSFFMVSVLGFRISAGVQGQRRGFEVAPIEDENNQGVIRRHALVIGNADYLHLETLRNPVNDARAITEVLGEFGFRVRHLENATQEEMKKEIRYFHKLQSGSVGLFYYAGHAVVADDRNYLIPVDAEIEHEYEVEDESVPLSRVLGAMGDDPDRLKIVILDSCRNNPYSWRRSPLGGLIEAPAPSGTLIAYAAAPGQAAYDGSDGHGVFTSELLVALEKPERSIEEILKSTREAVVGVTRTSDKPQKVPWISSSLVGEFVPSLNGSQNQKAREIILIEALEDNLARASAGPDIEDDLKTVREINERARGLKKEYVDADDITDRQKILEKAVGGLGLAKASVESRNLHEELYFSRAYLELDALFNYFKDEQEQVVHLISIAENSEERSAGD